jgi:predicted dehydrogenase/nucleoside-diphosphate-sugar epimerase
MSAVEQTRAAPPRLLIVGAGAVVNEYYIPALRALGWERHALIVDASFQSLRRVRASSDEVGASQLDFRHAISEVSHSGGFDACVVALPNQLHAEACVLALEHGLHVLCEKPLALKRAACDELALVAERCGRVLVAGMVRRLLPSFQMLRQALRQGLIGELTGIEVEDGEPYSWSSDSGAAFRAENGGVLADMGVHYLDLIEEIGGDTQPVSYTDDFQGGAEANLEYALRSTTGNLPIRLQLSRTRRLRNAFVCRGRLGTLLVEKDRFDGCWWQSAQTGGETWLQPRTPLMPTLEACFAQQLVDFAGRMRGEDTPVVSAQRAASTIGLIEWAYRERTGRRNGRSAEEHPRETRTATGLPPSRVCITGATGFIGAHLVERLGRTGRHPLVAPVRSFRNCAQIARFPITMPRCDLLDYGQVAAAVSGAQFVFHLAYGRDGPQPERVTIEGTRNVVEAAIATGAEAVVVLSTIYVFGQPAGEVDEAWPYHPVGGVYGTSKALMERWCLRRAQGSARTRVIVLCPSCVYGPGGDAYTTLPVRMARDAGFCWVDEGRGAANYTYVENLVDAMLLGAMAGEAHGRRFIINDGTESWRSFLHKLLGDLAETLPSYTRGQLRELHRRRPRPNLVDVARIAMSDQSVRTALRETRLGEAALWGAEHATPGVIARMRRGWHAPQAVEPRSATTTREPLAAVPTAPPEPLPPVWLPDLFGPAQTVFRADTARQVLGWVPSVGLDEGMRATRAWIEANI